MAQGISVAAHRVFFSDIWESISNDTRIPIGYALNSVCRPLKASLPLNLSGSLLGGFLIFPEMSNSVSPPTKLWGHYKELIKSANRAYRSYLVGHPPEYDQIKKAWHKKVME